jgi:putative holliday junction resolvase
MNVHATPTGSVLPVRDVPAALQQWMAFDFGTKRTGVAVGNRITYTAQALTTVTGHGAQRWQMIDAVVAEWAPQAMVIGVPFHPDGNPHENTRLARQFGRQLAARYHLQVYEADESYTTTEALAGGAKDLDGAAACLILEQFLRALDASAL